MKLLHVAFKAFTATYKMPFVNTGVAISAPVPSFSNIVGIISCCAGRQISIDETLIGFTYKYHGLGRDLETTHRLGIDSKGNLKKVAVAGIATREFHVNPELDIYLSNTELKNYFYKPCGVPVLGRSQDIAWITKVEEIEAENIGKGRIKATLIPFPCEDLGGRVIRYCDYFENEANGYLRTPTDMMLYQVVPFTENGVMIKRESLYAISDNEVIYMHRLGSEN